jgi:hypothetical protein
MKKQKVFPGIVVCLCLAAFPAVADITVWTEDFSDTSDWNIIFNAQGDASTISSDGNLGTFFAEQVNNEVAFAPNTSFLFSPLDMNDFSMLIVVDSLTGSVSYDVRLDMFNNAQTYLGTVFNVVPQGTFTGTDTINLGGFSYDPNTAYLSPKITVFTGPDFGDQSVVFNELTFSQVPEPSVLGMLALGLAGLVLRNRRR